MNEQDVIKEGDLVSVNFHNSNFTLSAYATVLSKPCATGDSWVFKDNHTQEIHYVSEGCTITKITPTEQQIDNYEPDIE